MSTYLSFQIFSPRFFKYRHAHAPPHPSSPRLHKSWEGKNEGKGHTHALNKSAEVFHLCSKKQVTKLGISKENNEEHDGKAQYVLGTAGQCRGELHHGFVEADVLEYLQGKPSGEREKVKSTEKSTPRINGGHRKYQTRNQTDIKEGTSALRPNCHGESQIP